MRRCLGLQLMGEAFGGHFEHSPEREIGLFPIALAPSGLADALLAHDYRPMNGALNGSLDQLTGEQASG